MEENNHNFTSRSLPILPTSTSRNSNSIQDRSRSNTLPSLNSNYPINWNSTTTPSSSLPIESNFLFNHNPNNHTSNGFPLTSSNQNFYQQPFINTSQLPIPNDLFPLYSSLPNTTNLNGHRRSNSGLITASDHFSPTGSNNNNLNQQFSSNDNYFHQNPPQTGPIRRNTGSSIDESKLSEADLKEDKRKRNAESSARHREKTRSRLQFLEQKVEELEKELAEARSKTYLTQAVMARDDLIDSLRIENYDMKWRETQLLQSGASSSRPSGRTSPGYAYSSNSNSNSSNDSPQTQLLSSLPLPRTSLLELQQVQQQQQQQCNPFMYASGDQNSTHQLQQHHYQQQQHLQQLQQQQQQQLVSVHISEASILPSPRFQSSIPLPSQSYRNLQNLSLPNYLALNSPNQTIELRNENNEEKLEGVNEEEEEESLSKLDGSFGIVVSGGFGEVNGWEMLHEDQIIMR